jgi:DNA-binding NarL/FixJ family response regulator
MAGTAFGLEETRENDRAHDESQQFIRVIVADTQAIFRAGLRKIFALEDDIRVVGQAETLTQSLGAAAKFSADILIFEAALATNPVEAILELIHQAPGLKIVVVVAGSDRELTVELFRRGAHGVVSREIDPEMFVDCLRKVAAGQTWLDAQSTQWALDAFRTPGPKGAGARAKAQLTPKEALIVTCVTQGMKNREIAVRVGTTEQVVKNYLRKVYDKLGVADRLELALFCLNNRVEGVSAQAGAESYKSPENQTGASIQAPIQS